MGDASPFCAHFVQLDAEYTCSRYGRACCRSCGFVKFNSLFARSAKNDPSILKARSRIDSVMVKVADPNSLIDLRKDFLHTVDESVQLENAGISNSTPKPTTPKPPRKKFSPMNRRRFGPNSRTRRPTRRLFNRPSRRPAASNRPAPTPRPRGFNRLRQRLQNLRGSLAGRRGRLLGWKVLVNQHSALFRLWRTCAINKSCFSLHLECNFSAAVSSNYRLHLVSVGYDVSLIV